MHILEVFEKEGYEIFDIKGEKADYKKLHFSTMGNLAYRITHPKKYRTFLYGLSVRGHSPGLLSRCFNILSPDTQHYDPQLLYSCLTTKYSGEELYEFIMDDILLEYDPSISNYVPVYKLSEEQLETINSRILKESLAKIADIYLLNTNEEYKYLWIQINKNIKDLKSFKPNQLNEHPESL